MRRIAHISDLHFGRHDPRKVDALLHSLDRNRPDLVVVSGDLTQRARRTEFAEARRFLDRIGRPIIVVPGNHDVPLYAVHHRLLQPFRKFDRFIAPAGIADSFFADADVAVLGLNTARRMVWKAGRVSFDQMSTIRRAFADLPQNVWKLLVTHHPLASVEEEPMIELAGRAKLAVRTVAEAGVHILLSGHHHRSLVGGVEPKLVLNGSVLVVHAGTAVSTRTRSAEGNSYNFIQLESECVAVTIMEWSQAGFHPAEKISYAFQPSLGRLERV
jgi:3',5'-cyclic AMP phosphodiesterase CpdA